MSVLSGKARASLVLKPDSAGPLAVDAFTLQVANLQLKDRTVKVEIGYDLDAVLKCPDLLRQYLNKQLEIVNKTTCPNVLHLFNGRQDRTGFENLRIDRRICGPPLQLVITG
jgi:hypothetical protein